MRDRKLIIFVILLMAVGFAVVSVNLIVNGGIKIGTNVDGFDVYFSEALLDREESNKIILSGNRKTITYETNDLTSVGDTSELTYKVKNNSNIYNAKVRINCHTEENEYVTVTANFNGNTTPAEDEIRAGEELPGVINARLKKGYAGDNTLEVEIKCEIEARAEEEETTRIIPNFDNPGITYNEEVIIAHDIYYKDESKYSNGLNERYKLYCTEYEENEESGIILCSKTNKEGSCKKVKNKTCEYEDVAGIFDKVKFTNQTKRYNFADAGNGNWHIQTYCNTVGEETDYSGGLYYCDSKKDLHDWYIIESDEIIKIENKFDFVMVGETRFITPLSGTYKLEVWGAQGGYIDDDKIGLGGYSVGEINLKKNISLYVNVGGAGGSFNRYDMSLGGYNGGGHGGTSVSCSDCQGGSGGGGATHIAKVAGELKELSSYKGSLNSTREYYISDEILIVAGGGGGSEDGLNNSYGNGSGGGYIGSTGGMNSGYPNYRGVGGTQTQGGYNYNTYTYNAGFGVGGNLIEEGYGGNGGGGGFFGGGGTNRGHAGAGGGSGYIANPNLQNKAMYCSSCSTSTNSELKTISVSTYSYVAKEETPKQGNGYARITYLG